MRKLAIISISILLMSCSSTNDIDDVNDIDDEKPALIEIHETLQIFHWASFFFKQ
ncbi:hypothetical protein L4D09_24385 [Photobacterium makurazakiensis]|uniref:hypothetical protein n=1 Tax=Photobacterium makurazakiensis TaxID=2910234 RepID=UPI003D0C0360